MRNPFAGSAAFFRSYTQIDLKTHFRNQKFYQKLLWRQNNIFSLNFDVQRNLNCTKIQVIIKKSYPEMNKKSEISNKSVKKSYLSFFRL